MKIGNELKKTYDLDYKVTELNLLVGKTLVGANGAEVKITEVTPHLDGFKGILADGRVVSFGLRAIVYNLENGKGSIK